MSIGGRGINQKSNLKSQNHISKIKNTDNIE
jgi:hypothetical protein